MDTNNTYVFVMKHKVLWLLLSESVVQFSSPLLVLSKDHNKECPLKKFEYFSKSSLVEISSKRLRTLFTYGINKQLSEYVNKKVKVHFF